MDDNHSFSFCFPSSSGLVVSKDLTFNFEVPKRQGLIKAINLWSPHAGQYWVQMFVKK
jgi:hypothetical protein